MLAACDASSSGGSTGDPRLARCGELAAHVVELRLAGVEADLEQHRRALMNALGDGFAAACVDRYEDPAIACALAAVDHDTAGQCLGNLGGE